MYQRLSHDQALPLIKVEDKKSNSDRAPSTAEGSNHILMQQCSSLNQYEFALNEAKRFIISLNHDPI